MIVKHEMLPEKFRVSIRFNVQFIKKLLTTASLFAYSIYLFVLYLVKSSNSSERTSSKCELQQRLIAWFGLQ